MLDHPLCRQHISDTIDVDNAADYNEMVKKIINKKPIIVRILINKHLIEKGLQAKHARSGSGSVSSAGESNKVSNQTSYTT